MKVFTIDKLNELDKEYGLKKASRIKLDQQQKFNCILIENPANSNCIYTISNIKLCGVKDGNKLRIMIGDDTIDCKHKKIYGEANIGLKIKTQELNIEGSLDKKDGDNLLEIEDVLIKDKKELEVSSKHWFILLPTGCLYLKLDKELSDLEIDISWAEEKLD